MPIRGWISAAVLPPGGLVVCLHFGWSALLGEAEVLSPADLVLLHSDEPVCPSHELLHGGHGIHDQLKRFHRQLFRGALDLAINSPEATGELGDILVLSHPEGH